MPPKSKPPSRSKSPKHKKGSKGRADETTVSFADEVEELAPPKKEEYRGPRPDQELLRAVHIDAISRDASIIEDIYALLWKGEEDPNQRNYSGFSPIHVAAASGDHHLVALLLERGGVVTIASIDKGELPIHHAARLGRLLIVQQLLEATMRHGLLDQRNNQGFTSLMLASSGGHSEVIQFLLQSKADASASNPMFGGVTSLHAAIQAGSADTAELLLNFGCPVDDGDSLGRSALHGAARQCNPQCVSLLLRCRADPDRCDDAEVSPLASVPADYPQDPAAREKVIKILQAYERKPTEGRRRDARFDRREEDNEADFF